jgi:dCMP deaminase
MTYSPDILERLLKCASLSKKPNTKVGAILVDKDNNIIFEASNDYICPLYEDPSIEVEADRRFYSEHAERRLIFSAVNSGFCAFQDKTLVVTHFPCCDCARAIILVGIKKMIVCFRYMDDDFLKKWEANIAVSKKMLEYNKVDILFV